MVEAVALEEEAAEEEEEAAEVGAVAVSADVALVPASQLLQPQRLLPVLAAWAEDVVVGAARI
jgi:hypothetical protein